MGLFSKIFGTHSERELKLIEPVVARIEALETEYHGLTDAELKAKTPWFRERLAAGETPEDILPEAFAAVREAAVRVLGERPYRVQLIGGMVLYQGRIAEMKTGEGKTLVSTLPAYLGALTGKGVHIVTVNDYLAKRDSEWMGKVYRFMGLSVGLIVHGLDSNQRREAYNADITYGTNNELGFDYLRDNMALYKEAMVCRGRAFAIVDEVDSILIDEARTPLIISGMGEESTAMYQQADRFVQTLHKTVVRELESKESHDDIEGDYIVEEKARSATLTPAGVAKAEKFYQIENLTDPENTQIMHHIQQALQARGVMKRDVDYVVKDGAIIIVDSYTGRLMFGRRYSEGLHQAIEAKENIKVGHEQKTLATITFQNFFRLYDKLSGMTGTALTEAEEFSTIYKLDIIEIPTNQPVRRADMTDVVYKNVAGKVRAILRQIEECHQKGQPVLVGTVSIENSETLSAALGRTGVKHNVLNAKSHEREAEIIAQAGRPGAVTIATNMAGRGTDIKLGGNPEYLARAELRKRDIPEEVINDAVGHADTDDEEILAARAQFTEALEKHKRDTETEAKKVRDAGGLFILGTERHESRRIDNQLRGRAGRQGDPGASRFFISMEDDLMRRFGTDRFTGMLESLGLDEDMPIDQKILSNAIESAQKRVESHNFQIRKSVLQFDDVVNKQREIIYTQRARVLEGQDLRERITAMIGDNIERAVDASFGERKYAVDARQIEALLQQFTGIFLTPGELRFTQQELNELTADKMRETLTERASAAYEKREAELTPAVMRELERVVLLHAVDSHWMDHIDAMDELRRGVRLRHQGETESVTEYTRESFEMFDAMNTDIRDETVRAVFTVRVRGQDAPQRRQVARVTGASGARLDGSPPRGPGGGSLSRAGRAAAGGQGQAPANRPVSRAPKVGRNEPCPCGSGKKYKKCCGFDGTATE